MGAESRNKSVGFEQNFSPDSHLREDNPLRMFGIFSDVTKMRLGNDLKVPVKRDLSAVRAGVVAAIVVGSSTRQGKRPKDLDVVLVIEKDPTHWLTKYIDEICHAFDVQLSIARGTFTEAGGRPDMGRLDIFSVVNKELIPFGPYAEMALRRIGEVLVFGFEPETIKNISDQLKKFIPLLPQNAIEQLQVLPSSDIQKRILKSLRKEIVQLIDQNGITIDKKRSTSRVKKPESIEKKLKRRGADKLVLDIYGMRFIVSSQEDITKLVQILRECYPTPDFFPGKIPSLRDYNDPTIPYNPHRQDDYRATHLNICFSIDGNSGIAEIQIMTREQFDIAKKNRKAMKRKQKSY